MHQFLLSKQMLYIDLRPNKHAIPKTAEVHILLAWASLTDNMGQG